MPDEVKGLLYIDKPCGPTSHDVVRRIRQICGIRRVGHTGTLDPLASGLLILCLGRATRLSEFLMGLPKSYHTTLRLGQETTTYDTEGELVDERPVRVTMTQLNRALAGFRGTIEQIPPMFSAVKHEGKPLYRQARRGLSVKRQPRTVNVYLIEIIDWNPPLLELAIDCSAGTYIRSIAHDLGQVLGCGGHVTALRRTAVGIHSLEKAVGLDELDSGNWQTFLMPAETAVSHLPVLMMSAQDAAMIIQGRYVPKSAEGCNQLLVQAYDPNDRFIGVLESVDDLWHGKKIMYEL